MKKLIPIFTILLLIIHCLPAVKGDSEMKKAGKTLKEVKQELSKSAFNKKAIKDLKTIYTDATPKKQSKIKLYIRQLYYKYIDSDMKTAFAYRDIHNELVNIASENEPLFSYGAGTQFFGSHYYHHPDKNWMVQVAELMVDMGTDTFKTGLWGKGATILEIAKNEHLKEVFNMPFKNYLLWVNEVNIPDWNKGGKDTDKMLSSYQEMYDLACYFLKEYNNTGKTFLIGHWEGDWCLYNDFNWFNTPHEDKFNGFIAWLNMRQDAIEAAKRDTPHTNIRLFHYTEGNLIWQAMERGQPYVVNRILPYTRVDFYSYSSYDISNGYGFGQSYTEWKDDKILRKNLMKGLDFAEKHLPPKDIPGKRIFIGEFGFALYNKKSGKKSVTPEQQDMRTRWLLKAALQWGCPFVLYWQFYCNEKTEDHANRPAGYWMIDDKNKKQPVYFTYIEFYKKARAFIEKFQKKNDRQPTQEEFNQQAIKWLD